MRLKIGLLSVLLGLSLCSYALGAMDLEDEGPKGKSWVKITDIHYMDKKSVRKVKGKMYEAKVANYAGNSKSGFWAYYNVRVDCATKKAWSQSGGTKWIGPMAPANYDEGVMKVVCK